MKPGIGPDSLDEIRYSVIGDGVAEIVLDRPTALNAISARPGGTRDQIVTALASAEDDPDVGCVVVRGEGRAFCGGGDLAGNTRRETAIDELQFLERADAFHERMRASTVPIIAAVHGFCLGAGLNLAASCDFVIAGAGAQFGFPEGRIGLVGASSVVPVIGRQWAKFLILTGELLTAEQARDIGLVLTVETDDLLLDRALDLAGRIARMPREAVLANRRSIDATADASGDSAARQIARSQDSLTLAIADRASAPDGRSFRAILDADGMDGLKAARALQYTRPWLG